MTFGTGQACSDEGVRGIDLRVHVERPAGDHHCYDRNALALELPDQIEAFGIAVMQRDVWLVSHEFGIGLFTENHDGEIGFLCRGAVSAEDGPSAGCVDLRFQSFVDRSPAGEVIRAVVRALPAERPASRLPGV